MVGTGQAHADYPIYLLRIQAGKNAFRAGDSRTLVSTRSKPG